LATPIPTNRARLSLGEIAAATGGTLVGLEPAREIEGVAIDSRRASAGSLFVALRGAERDGHAFAAAAGAAGAVVLVARDAGVEVPRIEVDDTLVALGGVARAHVDRSAAAHGPRPTLAVGGAAGKTTTKSLALAAVEALFGSALAGAGNLNNRIGVPMILLGLEERHRAVVLECATSERGEIAALGAIARPDVALVLNLGLEHSLGLGTLEEIADEESQLLLAAREAAVTAADEPLLVNRLARARAPRRLLFGSGPGAAVRPLERTMGEGGRARIRLAVDEPLRAADAPASIEVPTTLLGPHAPHNFAAAVAGALALLGRPADAGELDRVAAALAGVEAVPGRLRPLHFGPLLVLDDAYNSNPRSAAAALETAAELAAGPPPAPLDLVLGDMLELGDEAPAAHDDLIARALALEPRNLLVVGPECGAAARRSAHPGRIACFDDSAAAAAEAGERIGAAGVVLVKGSRGMRMERVAVALAARAGVELAPGL